MISVRNLNKNYGEKIVYKDFNIDIEENKTLVILGESGSGKTTLLNVLANLTEYSGEISGKVSPVSMVFQKDFLAPNLTVEQNLKLVCKDKDVLGALKSVGLEDSAKQYPKSLSGGMARRVAILRALLYDSPLLLLDEPTNSLDLGLKNTVYKMLKSMLERYKKTVVLVTHDIDEALFLADRIIIIKDSKIEYSYNFSDSPIDRDITGEESNTVRKKLIEYLIKSE